MQQLLPTSQQHRLLQLYAVLPAAAAPSTPTASSSYCQDSQL
jgi:hypothetical protein